MSIYLQILADAIACYLFVSSSSSLHFYPHIVVSIQPNYCNIIPRQHEQLKHAPSLLSSIVTLLVFVLQSFTSIVGPNGSGKSNVIDSMLFVFGYRAQKIR